MVTVAGAERGIACVKLRESTSLSDFKCHRGFLGMPGPTSNLNILLELEAMPLSSVAYKLHWPFCYNSI